MHHFNPITVNRRSSIQEREEALRQIYYQALERQPYAFERKQLAQAEKDFLHNKIGVRRFLKELGPSDVYLNAFYYPSSNPKFIETCLKHFLGRSVRDGEEMRTYIDTLIKTGVNSFINSMLDSEEYRKFFGCFTVPYPRGQQCYESPKAYLETHILRHEHFGQRGWSIPTLYWHQLGLNCDGGVCIYMDDDDAGSQPARGVEAIHQSEAQDELLRLLKGLEASQAKQLVASLSPQHQEALRKAMMA